MKIETKRLILREFALDDLADLHEIFSDPIVMEHTEPPYDLAKTRQFLEEFCIEEKGAVAAVCKTKGKLIGYMLFNEHDEPEIYQIGWIFNKDFWGRGLAYEAAAALISHGFEDLKLHKIFARAEDAVKSVGLMKKLGMVCEGVFRKNDKSPDGTKWLDRHYYAILREDYGV